MILKNKVITYQKRCDIEADLNTKKKDNLKFLLMKTPFMKSFLLANHYRGLIVSCK